MKKLKWIYICNHCGDIALPEIILSPSEAYPVLPEGWGDIGNKTHLCPKCYKAFNALREVKVDE